MSLRHIVDFARMEGVSVGDFFVFALLAVIFIIAVVVLISVSLLILNRKKPKMSFTETEIDVSIFKLFRLHMRQTSKK